MQVQFNSQDLFFHAIQVLMKLHRIYSYAPEDKLYNVLKRTLPWENDFSTKELSEEGGIIEAFLNFMEQEL